MGDYQKAALEGFARVISRALIIRDSHSITALGDQANNLSYYEVSFKLNYFEVKRMKSKI